MIDQEPRMVVSWSEINTARACLHQHDLGYKQRWSSTQTSHALKVGNWWHLLMECWYTERAESAVWALLDGLASEMNEEQADILHWMLTGYLEYWGADKQWKILAVEHPFAVSLPPTANGQVFALKGFIDLIVQDLKGRVWIIDHKSSSRKPQGKLLDVDDQFALYAWAYAQEGTVVAGTIHNFAQTKPNKDRSKQTLEARFARTPMARTPKEMQAAAQDAAEWAEIAWTERAESPRSPDPERCQYRCDFTDVCIAGRRGKDEQRYLDNSGGLFWQDTERLRKVGEIEWADES